MASVNPKTVRESLYWSYANLAMAFASAEHDESDYQQTDYIVRNKIYYGVLRDNLKLGSFIKDEKEKIYSNDACCYCGSQLDLTLDHLIPQFKGGEHSADNLVVACRSCNSSKKALDLLEWMAKKGEFPPLILLRRYLKLAIGYCIDHRLMDVKLDAAADVRLRQALLFDDLEANSALEISHGATPAWPFAIDLIPHRFPVPNDLVARVRSAEQERAYAEWAAACGPELLAAEKQWQVFSAADGYILAIYKKGRNTTVDVLKVSGAFIEGQRKKSLKLSVEAPRLVKDEFLCDYLEWEGGFEIPIHKVLYTEALPPSFYQQGVPAYRQALERGVDIAKKL